MVNPKFDFIFLGQSVLKYQVPLDIFIAINHIYETNFHNLPFFHNYLLDPVLQAICIFFGWIGWRNYPFLSSLPSKKLQA